jgi:hypothetical protein
MQLSNAYPKFLNGSAVIDISLLQQSADAISLWNTSYGPIASKFLVLVTDLLAAKYPPAGKTNPYVTDGKILVAMKIMYRTKEAFATWEFEQKGTQEVLFQTTKSLVYCLIDQYEIALYAPPYKQPIIL